MVNSQMDSAQWHGLLLYFSYKYIASICRLLWRTVLAGDLIYIFIANFMSQVPDLTMLNQF